MSLSIGPGINIVGSVIITPATGITIPDNPIIGTAVSRLPTIATVPYTAPVDDGGSTILNYTATSTPGGVTATLTQAGSGTITVNGLQQSTNYTFRVTATNSIGISSPSVPSNIVLTPGPGPLNTVDPVVSGTATVGQTLSTTDGTWTGTAPITFTYQWQRNGVNITSATSSTYTLVDADANNPIRCIVTATNVQGSNIADSNSTSNVAAIVPGAPTVGVATVIKTTATVAYTAPVNNGGATIVSYTATSSPGGLTGIVGQTGSGNISVTGLTVGTSYTFTVTATNSVGTGSPSASSNSITAYDSPSNTVAPVVSGTAAVGQTLSTTNGTWAGSIPITFTYQWQRNGVNITSATSSTYTTVAADANCTIRCVVTGTNAYGNSFANSNSTSGITGVSPGAPIIGTATATGFTTAIVEYTAPTSDGGSTIISYTATSSPGNITATINQYESGNIIMTGLTTGTSYTFTVTATNLVGTGSPSAASNSITTYSVPVNTVAPVVSGTATVGQTLSTTNGTWTGTAPITFTYQWQRAGANISLATSSTYTLVAADAGYTIRCVVTGTNAYGNSFANSNSTANIAPTVPGAPNIGTATSTGETTATVAYTAPASNGGSIITLYTATSTPGSITGTLSQAGSGTISVGGLTPESTYSFTVTATNSVGNGSPSTSSNTITTNSPPAGLKKAIFGFGFITGGVTSITNIVSYTGVVSLDVTNVNPSARGGVAAASYGGDKAIFGFGYIQSSNTYVNTTNLVSNTGVVANNQSSTVSRGTRRYALAAATYGGDKAIFGFGYLDSTVKPNYKSMTNLVSNTGAVASDTAGVGQARYGLAGAGYGTDKGIFGFGNFSGNLRTLNLVSNTGVVAANSSTLGTTARYAPGAAKYGGDKAIFGYGYTTVPVSMTNLVSNTGVMALDIAGVGTARFGSAGSSYGGDKAIFGYGNAGTAIGVVSMTNLVTNTGVVASDTTGVGTARSFVGAAGFSSTI